MTAPSTLTQLGAFCVHHLESCTSTMDVARDIARSGQTNTHLETVWAEEQSFGRGRQGRVWQSPKGMGLYFTSILHSKLPTDLLGLLPLAVGVAIVDAAHQKISTQLKLKWPNDLLVSDGRKLAGILLEHDAQSGAILIGVGININQHHSQIAALEECTQGIAINRKHLLEQILTGIAAWNVLLEEHGYSCLRSAYQAHSGTFGRVVTVRNFDGSQFDGLALDVDATGALLVRVNATDVRRVTSAEVSVRHQV